MSNASTAPDKGNNEIPFPGFSDGKHEAKTDPKHGLYYEHLDTRTRFWKRWFRPSAGQVESLFKGEAIEVPAGTLEFNSG